jgi:hypothetical protein
MVLYLHHSATSRKEVPEGALQGIGVEEMSLTIVPFGTCVYGCTCSLGNVNIGVLLPTTRLNRELLDDSNDVTLIK